VNRVRCPNCNKGWDTDGDGNCPCCLPKRLRPVNGQWSEEEKDLVTWPAWLRKENND
jgi:hypothetical protein